MDKFWAVIGAVLVTVAVGNVVMENYVSAILIALLAIATFYTGSREEKSKSQ